MAQLVTKYVYVQILNIKRVSSRVVLNAAYEMFLLPKL